MKFEFRSIDFSVSPTIFVIFLNSYIKLRCILTCVGHIKVMSILKTQEHVHVMLHFGLLFCPIHNLFTIWTDLSQLSLLVKAI